MHSIPSSWYCIAFNCLQLVCSIFDYYWDQVKALPVRWQLLLFSDWPTGLTTSKYQIPFFKLPYFYPFSSSSLELSSLMPQPRMYTFLDLVSYHTIIVPQKCQPNFECVVQWLDSWLTYHRHILTWFVQSCRQRFY